MVHGCFFTRLLIAVIYVLSLIDAGKAQLQIASACYGVRGCNTFSLSCDGRNEVLRVISLQYGIKTYNCDKDDKTDKCYKSGGCCHYTDSDCFGNFSQLQAGDVTRACAGKSQCGPLQAPFNLLSSCDNKLSTYVVIKYECGADVIATAHQTSIATTGTRNVPFTSSKPATNRSSTPLSVTTTSASTTTSNSSRKALENDPDDDDTGIIVASVLIPVAVLCSIAVVIGCLLWRRRRMQKIPKQAPEISEDVYSEIVLRSSNEINSHHGPMYNEVYESSSSQAQMVSPLRPIPNGGNQTSRQDYDQVYEPGRLNQAQVGANETTMTELETSTRVAANRKNPEGSVWYRKPLYLCRKKAGHVASLFAKRFPKSTVGRREASSAQEVGMTRSTTDEHNAVSRPNSSEQYAVNLGNSYIEFSPRLEPGDEQVKLGTEEKMLQVPKRPPPFPKQKNAILPTPVQIAQKPGDAAVVRYDYDTVPDPEYGAEFQMPNTTMHGENQDLYEGRVLKDAFNSSRFTANLSRVQESQVMDNEGPLYDTAYDGFEENDDEMTQTKVELKSDDKMIYDCHGYLVPRTTRLEDNTSGNCPDVAEKDEMELLKEKRKSHVDKEIWTLPFGNVLNKSKSESCILDTTDADATNGRDRPVIHSMSNTQLEHNVKFVQQETIVKSDNSTPKDYESSDVGIEIRVRDMARHFEQKKK